MRKSDTFVPSPLKTTPSHEDGIEVKNENCHVPDLCQFKNSENDNGDENQVAMSLKDEKGISLSLSFAVEKVDVVTSKIENNNLSDKGELSDLSEYDVLKLNVQDEIDLKDMESSQDMEISDDMADACKTVCEICQKTFSLSLMRYHTLKEHQVQITQYKLMYGNFKIIKKVYHKCHICGKTVLLDNDHLGGHIKGSHKMKEKEYKAKYMERASSKLQPSANKKARKDDVEGNVNIEVVKSGVKRKLKKFDCNSKISKEKSSSLVRKQKQRSHSKGNVNIEMVKGGVKGNLQKFDCGSKMSKEKIPSLVCKRKQRSDVSIESSNSVPKKKTKLSSKKINPDVNFIKEEILEVQNDEIIAHSIIENSQNDFTDVHENKPTEFIPNADESQDVESFGDVAKDISSDSTDSFKGYYSEWISDCENNELFCNGGPTVKEGWKICFEEWEIDGCKVMLAKYMSPGGVIYTRGEDGYQIPDLG